MQAQKESSGHPDTTVCILYGKKRAESGKIFLKMGTFFHIFRLFVTAAISL